MSDADITMRVRGRNETTGVFREVESQLGSLDKAASAMSGGLQGILGVAAGGFALFQAGQAVAELANLGAASMRVEESFKQMAESNGQNADYMLNALRKASMGTISDMDLMLNANRAMMLGVSTNADQLARLLEVSAVRGRALGRSTAEAFGDIVLGIGRASPMILDNLGILTGGQQAFDAYAKSIGKAGEVLTDVEKRQMLLNKVLADTTPLTNDAKTQFEQLGTSWQNLREAMGKEIVTNLTVLGVPEFMQAQADMIAARQRVTAAFKEAGVTDLQMMAGWTGAGGETMFPMIPDAELRAQRESIESLFTAFQQGRIDVDMFKRELESDLDALRRHQAAIEAEAQAQRDWGGALTSTSAAVALNALEMAQLAGQFIMIDSASLAAIQGTTQLGNAVTILSGKFLTAADRARMFGQAIRDVASAGEGELLSVAETMAAKTSAGEAYDAYLQWVKGLNGVIDAAKREGKTLDEITLIKGAYIAKTRDSINTIGQEDQATKDYNKTLDDLRGTIDSLISSAVGGTKSLVDFSPASGFDPNGPARDFGRMWDVAVNGFQSQWLDELRAQGLIPDDVIAQGEAALKKFAEEKSRAFQAGTDLSLLDKGQLVQQVRDQIAAQAEMKRVRDEVLAEILKDPSIGKGAATQALDTVLGAKGMDLSTQGEMAGPTFAAGFTGSLAGFGNKIADVLKTEIKTQEKAMQSAGEMAGEMWGGFFLGKVKENVPVELIMVLASLVTPEVLARLKANQNRTGGATP